MCLMLWYLFCLWSCCCREGPPVIIQKGISSSSSSPVCPVSLATWPASTQALLMWFRRKLMLPIQSRSSADFCFLMINLEWNVAVILPSLRQAWLNPVKADFYLLHISIYFIFTNMKDPRAAWSLFFICPLSLHVPALFGDWLFPLCEKGSIYSSPHLGRQYWSSKRSGEFDSFEPFMLLKSSEWTISSSLFSFHWVPISQSLKL